MNKLAFLFTLCCIAVNGHAQAELQQTELPQTASSIPAWVKVDRAALVENTNLQNAPDPRFFAATHTEQPVSHMSPFSTRGSSRISSIDMSRMEARPSNPELAREAEAPANGGSLRPAVNGPGGWHVSVPNIRRNVAKVLLQRKF
jgi:hypothetical protein